MKSTIYGHSDPGKTRTKNDDFYLMDEELGLAIVCDGVGSLAAGGEAAEKCARAIRHVVNEGRAYIQKYNQDRSLKNRAIVAGLLQKGIQVANETIYKTGNEDPVKKGMATTCVASIALGDYAVIGHVGDSRAYLYRGGQVHQLTEDHKFALEMIKKGILSAEDAAKSPQAQALTRAVGLGLTTQVDTIQVELMSGDMFLLCTDGLYGYFDKADMRNQFQIDVQKLPEHLVKLAKERGGRDNITGIAVKIDEAKEAKSDVIDVFRKAEIMGKIPIFKYMSYPELMRLLSIAEVKSFKKSEVIVQEGDLSDEMFIIVHGSAEVLKADAKVAVRNRGDVFGEMGIFDNAPRSATIRALEDTKAIALHRKQLMGLLRQESAIAVKLLWALNSQLNTRLRIATENVAQKMVHDQMESPFLPFDMPEAH